MENKKQKTNFITGVIDEYLKENKEIVTRFPPEPNGYLHIGHVKSICLNFGLAKKYNGKCNLRFDDTNPSKESVEYVESIKDNIKWLGFDWGEEAYFASNYFDKMYEYAIKMIEIGKAYVCMLSPDEMREYRGTLKIPGKNSPYRDSEIKENLELFDKMKNGEFNEGEAVLRAKIDMKSPNINLRDPIMYRIQKVSHHNTGDKWSIYPMYDWAHGLEDAIENITHSLCTLEFRDHRPLYEWFLQELNFEKPPRQMEFARLNMTYTVMSKRKLKELVDKKIVNGWDDPRLPTVSGMRRRGYTAKALREFSEEIGVAKSESTVDYEYLEHFVRKDYDENANRVMAVINPIKVIITNYPEDKEEYLEAKNHPKKPEMGTRMIPFSREVYIEREDFMEEPEKKFFRLAPGREVRFQHAYYITCDDVVKDENGEIVEIHCSYDPATRGGWIKERKVKGTLHWVSAKHAIKSEIREYNPLFTIPKLNEMDEGKEFVDYINPKSLMINKGAYLEPSLLQGSSESGYQFLRNGYYIKDKDSTNEKLVYNLVVSLKDSK